MKPIAWLLAAALVLGSLIFSTTAAQADGENLSAGDTAYVGSGTGYSGTQLWPVWSDAADAAANPDTPDYWVYCIEHDVHARSNTEGYVDDAAGYLGTNHFALPDIQAKVYWVLAHSYPAVSLDDLASAAGIESISENDAIEATQYAIWRYTDLTWDADWNWANTDSEAAYWYLVDGANDSGGLNLEGLQAEVSVVAPSAPQTADSLVGPFIVNTNQATARVEVDPTYDLVDASGAPIDANAIVDGQEVYIDLLGATDAGTVTVSAFARGSGSSGFIISSPTTSGGTPTAADHSQTRIIVADHTNEVSANATAAWSGTQPEEVTGSFDIVKFVEGGAAHLVGEDVEFTVVATWDGGGETFTVKNDGVPVTSPDLPVGTEITVTEGILPDIDGVVWDDYDLSCWINTPGRGVASGGNSQSFVLDEQNRSAYCTLTNVASAPEFGNFKIVKVVEGIAADRVGDGVEFAVVATWDGGSETFMVKNDGVAVTSPDLPAGVEITVTEGNLPGVDGVVWNDYDLQCTIGEIDDPVARDCERKAVESGNSLSFTLPKSTFIHPDAGYTVCPAGQLYDPVAQQCVVGEALTVALTLTNSANATPVIGTSLVDSADGDRVLPWNGGTVVDTVAYQNLVVGTEYTVSGELMLKADGSASGITSEVTFTPTAADGSVDLSFTVPAGFAGDTLVAFEWLFAGDVAGDRDAAIAEHADINDAAQTVVVEAEPVVKAPVVEPGELATTGSDAPIGGLLFAGLLMLLGAMAFSARRTRTEV